MALLAVLGVLVAAGFAYGAARAAPAPPAPPKPTITSGPSVSTASTSATFTYTDTQAAVTFQCKLDGAGFSTCPNTGKTYTGLADGSHTFTVVAKNGNSPISTAAARTWVVDTQAPALTRTFPSNNGVFGASTWNTGCTLTGVCGSASDPSGVSSVRVAVYQSGSPAFVNATLGSPGATSTSWRLSLPLPADGVYTVIARATDNLGNATTPAGQLSATFRIDTIRPRAPVITDGPGDPSFDTSPTFAYTDTEAGVDLRCSLDGAPFASCGAHKASYSHLTAADHCFRVRAADAAGNVSDPTSYCWTIFIKANFAITGSTDQLFSPGTTQPLDLVIGNPFGSAIKVVSVSISVDPGTTKNGLPNPACSGTQNMVVTRPFSGSVVVPKESTKSLTQLGVPQAQWPRLSMPNLATNQDACKATTFKFSYTGTATKP